ncbi:MAG: leucine--tRNA ligase [Elusimicrobia bacterium]|nr:leucine--tRNA ligase [Elusimicrobiota bacterium]
MPAPAYKPQEIESKWQERWDRAGVFKTRHQGGGSKFYVLDMFPYPSAAGLHVGHPEGYTATDIIARMKRMQGLRVLHPMGWDAFGLPTENYAIATGIHPAKVTEDCVRNFKRQIKSLGFSYDWDLEINTTDPRYYRWTQWIFLQIFKKGLAYEAVVPINFCPSCKTGLANEEVYKGCCERCGNPVEKRDIRQWMLKITAYADRLLEDLKELDWPESTLAMQRNWIGRSEGAEVDFAVHEPVAARGHVIRIFTTRPDTLFGATYMVLAPEHPLVEKLAAPDQLQAVRSYCKAAAAKTEIERTEEGCKKTGVFTGGYAVNPVNKERIPIWVADYVLMGYGTGAIMAVPAHDQRDWEFAKAYGLEIRQVVASAGESVKDGAFVGDGKAVNSGDFTGISTAKFKTKITRWLEEKKMGKRSVVYKLRDWVFSRQRYWGEPIPIIHCKGKCAKAVPVPEDQLPVTLPDVDKYQPTGTGDSPLVWLRDWVQTKCPACGGPGERETNTMPQWAGSCWYYLRFIDPKNDNEPWSKSLEKLWAPVDLYVGGSEHAVLHLLYARFWHKALYDAGWVSTKEPFLKLRHQGMILSYSFQDAQGAYHGYDEINFSKEPPSLGQTGAALQKKIEKMSKSKKNVVNPDQIIRDWGADTMRLYEMFMGEFELSKPWDMTQIEGVHRFLLRAWRLIAGARGEGRGVKPKIDNTRIQHKTIKLVTQRIEEFKFNTAISALMQYVNELIARGVDREDLEVLIKLLSPFAPHVAEECWEILGNKPFVSVAPWPVYEEALTREDKISLPVQINGKLRASLEIAPDHVDQEKVIALAKADSQVSRHLENAKIIKVIYVPRKILNFVVKDI